VSARCLRCGAAGLSRRHHPTGKDEQGDYLDPEFTLDHCHDCHELIHDDWHTAGLADEAQATPQPAIVRLELGLRRLAVMLARHAEAQPTNSLWPILARLAAKWAAVVAHTVRRWDERDPDWRRDPGFYGDPAPG
jgi:hypothetical protein